MMLPRLEFPGRRITYRLLGAALGCIIATTSHAENWKTVAIRGPDGASIFIDTDYVNHIGKLTEVQIKGKVPKNLFTLLLPDTEEEDRYVFDCSQRTFGMSYKQTTQSGSTTVLFDALPTVISLAPVPSDSVVSKIADWACSQSAASSSGSATAPTSGASPPPTGSNAASTPVAQWRWVATSADGQYSYSIDVGSITVIRGVVSFEAQADVSPGGNGSQQYAKTIARYNTTCVDETLTATVVAFYGADGRQTFAPSNALPNWSPGRLVAGSIGHLLYDAACAYARGGDMARSHIFPAGVKAPAADLRPTASSADGQLTFYVDRKSLINSREQDIAIAKVAILRIGAPTQPRKDDSQIDFEVVAFNCPPRNFSTVSVEMYDPFGRLLGSQYNDAKHLTESPIAQGSVMESVGKIACAAPASPGSEASTTRSTPPEGSSAIETGTAWYADDGYVVTAYHVVAGKKKILLYNTDRQSVTATIAMVDAANDIALLTADFETRPSVGLEVARNPATLGETVFTIGFPHPDLMGIFPKFTQGNVSAIAGIGDDPRYLQISVPVQAGNSGGPLVDEAGNVVGIISSKLDAEKMVKATGDMPQIVNYAIKARYLAGMLSDLGATNARVPHPKPGPMNQIVEQVKDAIFLVVTQ